LKSLKSLAIYFAQDFPLRGVHAINKNHLALRSLVRARSGLVRQPADGTGGT
jgi:hypothetical protein